METNKIYQGNCLEVLKTFPDDSINCVMTSPPYWALRNYGIEGQLGLEARKPTVHFHSLRHGYATHCVRQGVKLPYLQIMLGHSDLATTSVYLRVAPLEAATDVLNKW